MHMNLGKYKLCYYNFDIHKYKLCYYKLFYLQKRYE